jgi:hypothetical protein
MVNPIAGGTTGSVEALLAAAAAPFRGLDTSSLTTQMERLTTQLQQLQTVNQSTLESTRTNAQVVQATSAATRDSKSNSESSVGRSIGNTILSVLGTGLGISPLISGIVHLFSGGGGGSSEPSPLVKYSLPSSQSVNAGMSSAVPGQAFSVDSAQGGLPRPVTNTVSAPQITVQVQAMDSRSFLDHSNDIALAVRQAMLESSVLNDVVREA